MGLTIIIVYNHRIDESLYLLGAFMFIWMLDGNLSRLEFDTCIHGVSGGIATHVCDNYFF